MTALALGGARVQLLPGRGARGRAASPRGDSSHMRRAGVLQSRAASPCEARPLGPSLGPLGSGSAVGKAGANQPLIRAAPVVDVGASLRGAAQGSAVSVEGVI